MAILTALECARMAKVSKRTIQNKIKNGKLSATRDESGFYQIDSSEFFRVYPDANNREDQQEISFSVPEKENTPETNKNDSGMDVLKEKLESLERENKLLKEQLTKSETRENNLIETLKSNTRLLEHQEPKKRKKVFGIF